MSQDEFVGENFNRGRVHIIKTVFCSVCLFSIFTKKIIK